jgi:hypothetical protein
VRLKSVPVKNGTAQPCLNSIGDVCPCTRHSGEMSREKGVLSALTCEHRKMHKPPTQKKITPQNPEARLVLGLGDMAEMECEEKAE